MFNLDRVDRIAHRNIFNQISNTGGTLLQTSWNSNISLGFSPDFAMVTHVVYNTLSTSDSQIYEVLSSLVGNESIASFPGSNSTAGTTINPIQSNPNQLIKLSGNPLDTISFNIATYATDGTNIRSAPSDMAVSESSSISIGIDFYKLKQ